MDATLMMSQIWIVCFHSFVECRVRISSDSLQYATWRYRNSLTWDLISSEEALCAWILALNSDIDHTRQKIHKWRDWNDIMERHLPSGKGWEDQIMDKRGCGSNSPFLSEPWPTPEITKTELQHQTLPPWIIFVFILIWRISYAFIILQSCFKWSHVNRLIATLSKLRVSIQRGENLILSSSITQSANQINIELSNSSKNTLRYTVLP
jgi:hypothetical protein